MAESPLYQCLTCKSAPDSPRNLVVLIDGTSNKPGVNRTNVDKFRNVIDESRGGPGPQQLVKYLEGIGACETDQLSWLDCTRKYIFEQGLAKNVDENIKKAYNWLTEQYQEGDRIYLFGFSRGGFQVRALASVIHEAGLAKDKEKTGLAYSRYQAIDPYNPETRKKAIEFKKAYCWHGVRIHFVGVWDTVSSLGFIKKDVHVTASGSVTNACHFRHALALGECRVKFMPEYFLEMNARGNRNSQRKNIGDVKEVWFAGFHADVGGTDRPSDKQVLAHSEDDDSQSHSVHAGNVPLLWMQREAADKGLVFKPTEFRWDPEDVDFGTKDSMPPGSIWKAIEYLPIRHQVSFGGTGEHGHRWHQSDPRSVIPGQQVHTSILSGYMYTPRATLRNGVCIPTVEQNLPGGLWTTELPAEEATTRVLTSLLSDQHQTLECLRMVLFLLDSKLGNGQSVPQPGWSAEDILERSGFEKFTLTVIYVATSTKRSVSEEWERLVTNAETYLNAKLVKPSDDDDFHTTLDILRFLTKHRTLRQRFCSDAVIKALVLALERTAECQIENSFPLIAASLRNLVRDDSLRCKVIKELSPADGTDTEQSKLRVALEIKSPNELVVLLKMIATLCSSESSGNSGTDSETLSVLKAELGDRVLELAKKGERPVGPAAVEALIALKVPLTSDIPISNTLGYLCNTLPRLRADGGGSAADGSDTTADSGGADASGGGAVADGGSATADQSGLASANDTGDLFPQLPFDGFGPPNEKVVGELVSTIKSRDAHERTAATLTVVKLCRSRVFRESCTQSKVLDIFIQQLKKKRTSLPAAYALKICLRYRDMWSPGDFPRAAQLIVAMLNNGWFDDAVGQVEGYEILRGLMAFGDLRRHINTSSMCTTLLGKLEVRNLHEVRRSLLALDILGKEESQKFKEIVVDNIKRLKDKDKKVQTKGAKVLSGLAQTAAGEEVIKLYVNEILETMLHPSVPRGQLFGPASALYGLSKNETLREEIKKSPRFSEVKKLQRSAASDPKAG